MRPTLIITCLAALLAAPACKKDGDDGAKGPEGAGKTTGETAPDEPGAEEDEGPEAPPERPSGPTGTITGEVEFTGEAPEMPKLQMGSDPTCAKNEHYAETVVVNENDTLRDVHVRIARGAVEGWVPPEPVTIDQNQCVYRPRVQGGVIGQKLVVENSDATTHNVHLRSMKPDRRQGHETIFNRAQPKGVPPIKSQIVDEPVIKLKCDQHAWMQAYVVVSDHPYFDTTGEDGAFSIEEAPVGTYEIQAWHPLYGTKTAEITVEEGKEAKVSFTYDAEEDKPSE